MRYDTLKKDLSFQYNKIIKEYGPQDNIPRIYCDLDGTLCDFVEQLRIITGKSVDEWNRMKNKWDPVLNTPRFWETIPWHKEGKKLWNFIAPLNETGSVVSYYTSPKNYVAGTSVALDGTNLHAITRLKKIIDFTR